MSPGSSATADRGVSIVVLDSNPILVSVSGVLRMAGYRVFQAYDGSSAQELCRQLNDVALLVLNTQVDGLDSGQLFAAVRRDRPSMPILHIDTHRINGIPSDVPTLTEPFSAEELLQCVRRLLAPVRLEDSAGSVPDSLRLPA